MATYLISLTTSTGVKLLVYHLEDEFVAFANKIFQLNDLLGMKKCAYTLPI